MSLDPVTAVLDISGKLIDRLWPDPAQAAGAKLELVKMQASGELAQIAGQLEINKIEASSASWFTSGWRPFSGWVCGVSLAYATLIEPLLRFIASVWLKYAGPFPAIDTTLTMQLLFALLGIGAYRSLEKIKGVA